MKSLVAFKSRQSFASANDSNGQDKPVAVHSAHVRSRLMTGRGDFQSLSKVDKLRETAMWFRIGAKDQRILSEVRECMNGMADAYLLEAEVLEFNADDDREAAVRIIR